MLSPIFSKIWSAHFLSLVPRIHLAWAPHISSVCQRLGLVLLPSSSEELLVTTHYPFTSTALTTPEFGGRYPDLSQPSNLAISEGDL